LSDLSIDETGEEAGILFALRNGSQLEVEGVSEEKMIPIIEGRQTKHKAQDIEQNVISENPDLLTVQRSIPDQ